MKRKLTAIASACLAIGAIAAAPGARAQTGDSTLTTRANRMDTLSTTRGEGAVVTRIGSDFAAFAGSQENASALVTGLRNGTPITLDGGGTGTTTITPPTGRMGYGNVYISLALARQQLLSLGITHPTAGDIQVALTGGTVTSPGSTSSGTTLTGVLNMRADGMGWGQIANALGFKLGPVISGMRSANAHVAAAPAAPANGSGTTGTTTTTTSASGTTGAQSGVVSAAGGVPGQSHGRGNAYGRGIVTGAGGAAVSSGHGSAHGRGVVTAGGGTGGQSAAGSGARGKGQGLAKGQQ
jgi:hypothetical protein